MQSTHHAPTAGTARLGSRHKCDRHGRDARGGDGLFHCPVCTVPTERGFAPNFNMQQTMDLVAVACPECPWKGEGIKSYQDHISLWCPSVMQKSAEMSKLML